jgi:quercetin dioxygenase-like cupin family protein
MMSNVEEKKLIKNLIPSEPENILSLADYSAGSIVSKIMHQSESIQITLFAMAVGEEFSQHAVTRKALVHILEGEGDFMLADKWVTFKGGDYFLMEENLVHAMTAKTNVKFLLYLFH